MLKFLYERKFNNLECAAIISISFWVGEGSLNFVVAAPLLIAAVVVGGIGEAILARREDQ